MIRFWKKLQQKLANTDQREPEPDIKDGLQERYKSFLDLLTENEHSLDLMTELENKYYNRQLISIPILLWIHIFRMIPISIISPSHLKAGQQMRIKGA